jgi:hypothetical protein
MYMRPPPTELMEGGLVMGWDISVHVVYMLGLKQVGNQSLCNERLLNAKRILKIRKTKDMSFLVFPFKGWASTPIPAASPKGVYCRGSEVQGQT